MRTSCSRQSFTSRTHETHRRFSATQSKRQQPSAACCRGESMVSSTTSVDSNPSKQRRYRRVSQNRPRERTVRSKRRGRQGMSTKLSSLTRVHLSNSPESQPPNPRHHPQQHQSDRHTLRPQIAINRRTRHADEISVQGNGHARLGRPQR